MTRKKTGKQQPKKSIYKLPTEFNCPLCDRNQCVDIKLYFNKKQIIKKRLHKMQSLRSKF